MMDKAGQKSDAKIYEAWRDCFFKVGVGGGILCHVLDTHMLRVTCSV
jgi:hypothetical protein